MKRLLIPSGALPLALFLHADLINAEQPFVTHDLERRAQVSECRIFEFTCATCGHITDDEQWDENNRLISDVETCEKQRTEQSLTEEKSSLD